MMHKYLLADVDKLRAACLDGDLQAATRIRDEMLVFDTDCHHTDNVDARSWVYHSDKSLRESILFSVASLRFEICRWLLQGEKGMWSPEDLVRILDDVLYSTREKIDLRLVQLLVNALRHKKGRHRHDYLLRLATHGSSTLSSLYIVQNKDVVDYLVKCSLVYRAGPAMTAAAAAGSLAHEGENISILLLGIVGRKAVLSAEIGDCLAQILTNNDMDPCTAMAPHFWLCSIRNRNKTQVSVALHMGWVDRNWLVVAEMLLYQTCPRGDTFERFIKSMDFSELTGPLELKIMKLVLYSDLDHRILDIFVAGLGENLDASLTGMLLEFIMRHRYHDPLMTRFAMQHAWRSWSSSRSQQAVTLAIGAHSKIAAAVFYQQRTRHPHCFADPHTVSRMLAHGPQSLVYAVVWETNATLVQLVSGLFVCASAEGRLPGQRVCWVKEMYNLRVVLRQRGQKQRSFVRFGSTPPFPHRVALNVLQFGWLGETLPF